MVKKGVDVSRHNGLIDWVAAKEAGVEFAMIRAGYGQNVIDERFVRNVTECNRLGIPCGVYWFSYALNAGMAQSEAKFCLNAIKPYRIEYPVAFDFEYDSTEYAAKQGVKITKTVASAMAKAFLLEIEKGGYFAVNYTNIDYRTNMFTDEINSRFGLWLAYWGSAVKPPVDCYIWQYGAKQTKGFAETVDVNYSYIDFPTYLMEHGCNHLTDKWYTEARAWVQKVGISDGSEPEAAATRAEVWEMLRRYRDKFGG